MARRTIIAGNWKMHHLRADIDAFFGALKPGLAALGDLHGVEAVVAPVFPYLSHAAALAQGTPVAVAAQDVYWELKGAFTGEVAPAMLRDNGARCCIVGHSERRALFGDSDENVGRKARAVSDAGLTPIICCGELLAEREAGTTLDVVRRQLTAALAPFQHDEIPRLVIAYEPVWAIGTGKTATPEQAQQTQAAIRDWLVERAGAGAAATPILYGGSIKPDNMAALIACPDIDGGLVGGASLKAADFLAILSAAVRAR